MKRDLFDTLDVILPLAGLADISASTQDLSAKDKRDASAFAPIPTPLLSEADDYAGDTTTTGVLSLGGSVTGRVDSETDADWFAFTVEAGDVVTFGSSANFSLEIYDSSGDYFTYASSGPVSFDQAGTYFIAVDAMYFGNPVGTTYTLSASEAIKDDFLGNTATTGTIEAGGFASGSIQFSGDQDWFSITVDAGDVISFSNTLGRGFLIYDANGNRLQSSRNNDYVHFEDDGQYFVSISGYSVADYVIGASTPIRDDFAGDRTTTGVLLRDGSVSGSIDFSNDSDWFALTANANDIFRFSNSLGVDLIIHDANGQYARIDNGEAVRFDAAGQYFVSISDRTQGADYTLFSDSSTVDDFAGDTTTTGTVARGSAITGSIDFQNDEDWFEISVDAGDRLAISLDIYADLKIYDSNGTLITLLIADTQLFETAGTYYIGVSDRDEVNYTLSVSNPVLDDFAADTSTTGVLELGGAVSGIHEHDYDRDWFAISVMAGDIVQFSNSLSRSTEVFSAAGESLGRVSDGDGFFFDTTGTFFVSVQNGYTTSPYILTASTPSADDYSADTSTTGVLTPGGSVSGSTQYNGDSDWFAITVNAGDRIEFDMNGGAELSLYDANGTFISQVSTYLSTLFTEGGLFFIGVQSYFQRDYNVTASTPIIDDFADDETTTGVLAVGETTGRIDYRADVDAFALTVERGTAYYITPDQQSGVDISILGGSLTQSYVNGQAVYRYIAQDDGVVYVTVGDYSKTDYTLTLTTEDVVSLAPEDFSIVQYLADDDAGILYMTTDEGALLRYDVVNETYLDSIFIGGALSGLAFSADGQSLFVGQRSTQPTGETSATFPFDPIYEATVHEVDLATLGTVAHTFEVSSREGGVHELGVGLSSTLYATLSYSGSGWIDMREFDTNDLSLAPSIGRNVTYDTTIHRSEDGRYLLFVESNISSFPAFVIDTLSGNVIGEANFDYFNSGANAISASLGMVAIGVYDAVSFATLDLQPIGEHVAERVEAVTFSDNGRAIYILENPFSSAASITVLDAASLEEVRTIQLDQSYSGFESLLSDSSIALFLEGGSFSGTRYRAPDIVDFGGGLFEGTAGDDELTGSFGENTLLGLEGNDTLFGLAGLDVLRGGLGADRLHGGEDSDALFGDEGRDILFGDEGDDTLAGGDDNDRLDGGDGNDELSGDTGDDTLLGMNGNDTLLGGDGNDGLYGHGGRDRLEGGLGDDLLYGGGGDDELFGQEGNDRLEGFHGNDTLHGGDGDDTLLGQGGRDRLEGGAGQDRLFGGGGDDVLLGQDGNDRLEGFNGNDTLNGGNGDDALYGQGGRDRLEGFHGNDFLAGGGGNDVLLGQGGNDRLYGGTGNDALTGGGGQDIFMYAAGQDVVRDFASGIDVIDLTLLGEDFDTLAEVMAVFTQVGSDAVFAFSSGQTLTLNGVDGNLLTDADFEFAAATSAEALGKAKILAVSEAQGVFDSTEPLYVPGELDLMDFITAYDVV